MLVASWECRVSCLNILASISPEERKSFTPGALEPYTLSWSTSDDSPSPLEGPTDSSFSSCMSQYRLPGVLVAKRLLPFLFHRSMCESDTTNVCNHSSLCSIKDIGTLWGNSFITMLCTISFN